MFRLLSSKIPQFSLLQNRIICSKIETLETIQKKDIIKEKKRLYRLANQAYLKAKQAQYRLENKETIKERNKKYRLENKEKIKEYNKKYYRENNEILLEKKRLYRLANKELIKAREKKYRQENPDKIKEQKKKYTTTNKETIKQKMKQYRQKNKEILKIKEKKYRIKKRVKEPPIRKSWKTQEEIKQNLDDISKQLFIEKTTDWYRISREQIIELGGKGLLTRFSTLYPALKLAYPDIPWDKTMFSLRGKKSEQRWLYIKVKQLLPEGTEIFEDFQHPHLLWPMTDKQMELDIWVPKFKLGLEYQGEQHYCDLHQAYGPSGTMALYKERDLQKKKACVKEGITLVIVPYWWDGRLESLMSTLHSLRPELFQKSESPPIPIEPPDEPLKKGMRDTIKSSFLMHGREWHQEQVDPTGWFMSEKLDGIRAFWDGSHLYTKQGKLVHAPQDFISTLPRDIFLDGELWNGYDSFEKLKSTIIRSSLNRDDQLWNSVKYFIFDAPMYEGNYQQRHSFAQSSISHCNHQKIFIIPIQKCQGLDHLLSFLKDIIKKKGEGIMLYHPESKYRSGRTSFLLKVKDYKEDDVKFIQKNPNSYTFICEQKNGASCIVKCSSFDYLNPPHFGTVLSVKHSGFHEKSKKMKFPFLVRIRSDLSWEDIVNEAEVSPQTE